jgi:hypothetical protein
VPDVAPSVCVPSSDASKEQDSSDVLELLENFLLEATDGFSKFFLWYSKDGIIGAGESIAIYLNEFLSAFCCGGYQSQRLEVFNSE